MQIVPKESFDRLPLTSCSGASVLDGLASRLERHDPYLTGCLSPVPDTPDSPLPTPDTFHSQLSAFVIALGVPSNPYSPVPDIPPRACGRVAAASVDLASRR